MTEREALTLALEALEEVVKWYQVRDKNDEPLPVHNQNPEIKASIEAISAIKEALAQPEPWEKFCDSNCVWTDHHPDCKLAQPEQEPVAWVTKTGSVWKTKADETDTPLYTTPPQRKPLTDEEIKELYGDDDNFRMTNKYVVAFARAIEAAHGIKGEA